MERIKRDSSRRRNTGKKVLRAMLILLLAFCLISAAASAVVFRVLFPRQSGVPKLHYSYEELPEPPERTGFSFLSGKNRLQGWRYDAESPLGLIVVVNGIGSGADEHLPEIGYFVKNGWSVVTWDATGVGRSEGRGIIGLQQIREDLRAFLTWYHGAGDGDGVPMVLYSHSAGAYAAATCLSDDATIRAAVCISGFDRPVPILYHHAKELVGPLADLQYPFLQLENFFLFGSDANASAREALSASDTPVFIIGGSSDDLVPRQYDLLHAPEDYRNPNVRCMEVTSDYRSEHAAPWLSESAAEYIYYYGKSENVDKARASELDPGFMRSILDFYTDVLDVTANQNAA